MTWKTGIALILTLAAAPVAAGMTTITCTFPKGARLLIPAEITLLRNTETGALQVDDRLVREKAGRPVAAKVHEARGGRQTIEWEVSNIPRLISYESNVSFILTIDPSGRARVQTDPADFLVRHEAARGRCQ